MRTEDAALMSQAGKQLGQTLIDYIDRHIDAKLSACMTHPVSHCQYKSCTASIDEDITSTHATPITGSYCRRHASVMTLI